MDERKALAKTAMDVQVLSNVGKFFRCTTGGISKQGSAALSYLQTSISIFVRGYFFKYS
jgi:hypothetical protein